MLRIHLAITTLLSSCVLYLCGLVSAGLYPTTPIASTVWTAGRSAHIAWMDDSSAPRLAKLGDLDIELLAGDEAVVATLAERVKPTTKALDVWVSPSWGSDSTDYYVRFTSSKPPAQVYTATFTILNMSSIPAYEGANTTSTNANTTNTNSTAHTQAPPKSTPPPGASLYTPHLTVVTPHSTIVSALTPHVASAPPLVAPSPVSVDDEDEYKKHDSAPVARPVSDAGGGQRIDLERLKFRLVFIFWPALVGVTMAL